MSDCVFCERGRRGEYERTDVAGVVRFEPLNPVTPGHMLFVPEWHVASAAESPSDAGLCVQAAARYGKAAGEQFNIITSAGPDATQTVFHLHVHLVPRRMGDGLTLPWTGQKKTEETDRG